MQAFLQLNLLGGFELSYNKKLIDLAYSTRLQTLIAYIILHRSAPVVRQRLAFIFWPDTSESQARTNLRNLIHQLRQALPFISTYITINNSILKWRDDGAFRLDIDAFRLCLVASPGQTPTKEALAEAVQLYKGDLFPACYEDWIIPAREELHQMFTGALDKLALLQEEAREYPEALNTARRLVQMDPLQPAANERLMRLYTLVGDRPSALKTYRTYSRQLWQELGTKPDAQIEELYERIQAAAKSPDIGTIKLSVKNSAKPEERAADPLVGRTEEWRKLLSLWQNATTGKIQVGFITGEAGIGKTRLITELTNWAELQSIPIDTAVCYPAEGSLPYGPVMSWIQARPIPALDKVWLAEISRLLPELRQKVPGLPRLEPLHEAWQRHRLFEALARAVLGRSRIQILVLEDVQWCDRDTLEWLHFLVRFTTNVSLLVLVTMRHGEIALDHPLRAFQTALRAEGYYAEIELQSLAMADSIQLIEQIYQQSYHHGIDPHTAASIYQHSEGNPLFLVEMVRLSQASLENILAASGRIQAVLSHRLDQLSQGTREMTALAATIGREFDLTVLRQASRESDERLVAAIDELLHYYIIKEISADIFDFTHDLLRQAALSGLSIAHLRLLHRKAAEAYVHLDQFALHPRHAEIASHFERAGLAVQAVDHYRLAAEGATEIFANSNAWEYLRRAIELVESVGIGNRQEISFEDFAMILEKAGSILALEGKYQQALPYFERALAQPFTPSGIWRSQVYRKISDAWLPQHNLPDRSYLALDQAEQALGIVPPNGTVMEQQEWLQIQLNRIQVDYWRNFPDRMEALIQKIEGLVASIGRVGQQNTLLSMRYQARMRHERFRLSIETVQIVQQLLEQAEKLNDPFNLAIAQFQYGFALLWHGDPLAARDWLKRSNESLERLGARLPQLRCLAYLSVISRKLHEPEKLRHEIPPLLELARAINENTYLGFGLANHGWLAWQDGDVILAEQFCREAIAIWMNAPGYAFRALADWVLLAIALAQEDFSKSEAAARALMDPNPTLRIMAEPMSSLLSKALAACDAGDQITSLNFLKSALEAARIAGEV
ncbi:MAG TPA: AAA family ATPase [Anaerolineales bacterium]|nr:AAA family ATPase [Anaerolineales bacterium]